MRCHKYRAIRHGDRLVSYIYIYLFHTHEYVAVVVGSVVSRQAWDTLLSRSNERGKMGDMMAE